MSAVAVEIGHSGQEVTSLQKGICHFPNREFIPYPAEREAGIEENDETHFGRDKSIDLERETNRLLFINEMEWRKTT